MGSVGPGEPTPYNASRAPPEKSSPARKMAGRRTKNLPGSRTSAQSERNPMQPQEPPPPTTLLAGVLSYLVPGLGQIMQGRVGKGLLFFVCLVSLFHVGQAMGNWQNVYLPTSESRWARDQARPQNPLASIVHYRWHYAGQFWIGVAAWPALWQFYEMPVPDPQRSPFLSRYQ